MTEKDNLMYLIEEAEELFPSQVEAIADHLIANGVTVQRWIPVTERLPTEDDFKHLTNYECLVVERHYNLFDISRYVDRTGHAYWTGDEFISGHSTFHIPLNVTHWMPLPEPPKEVE